MYINLNLNIEVEDGVLCAIVEQDDLSEVLDPIVVDGSFSPDEHPEFDTKLGDAVYRFVMAEMNRLSEDDANKECTENECAESDRVAIPVMMQRFRPNGAHLPEIYSNNFWFIPPDGYQPTTDMSHMIRDAAVAAACDFMRSAEGQTAWENSCWDWNWGDWSVDMPEDILNKHGIYSTQPDALVGTSIWITVEQDEVLGFTWDSDEEKDALYAENPIGDDDWFYHSPDTQNFDAVYFNPDSNSGGEYVMMNLPYELISDAVEQTNTVDEFFEFLEERAYAEFVSITDDNFRDMMETYKTHPADFVGRTQETMDNIIKTVAEKVPDDPVLSEYITHIRSHLGLGANTRRSRTNRLPKGELTMPNCYICKDHVTSGVVLCGSCAEHLHDDHKIIAKKLKDELHKVRIVRDIHDEEEADLDSDDVWNVIDKVLGISHDAHVAKRMYAGDKTLIIFANSLDEAKQKAYEYFGTHTDCVYSIVATNDPQVFEI